MICKTYRNLDVCSSHVPQDICEGCRIAVQKKDEGKDVVLAKFFDSKSICLVNRQCKIFNSYNFDLHVDTSTKMNQLVIDVSTNSVDLKFSKSL